LGWLCLHLPGLHRGVAAAYGAQQQGQVRLSPMAPESQGMMVALLAPAREPSTGEARLAPARAQRTCRVSPATSDAAPGLCAAVAPARAAHPAPAWCHGPHARVHAVSGPMATQERAACQAVTEARAQLERLQSDPPSGGAEPAPHRPGAGPQAPVRLEQAAPTFAVARRAPARLEKAERVVPQRPATLACVARYGRQQGAPLAWTPPASCARPAPRSPSSYLARVAPTRRVSAGAPRRALATRLRVPVCHPGGV
jgi:hypothetical protein